MKAVFLAVLAAGVLVASGAERSAFADKPKVAVEQFSGPGADKLRSAVVKAVEKAGGEVVSPKKVSAVQADLGLMQISDSYSGIAKELKLSGFIGGGVSKVRRKFKARIVARDASGSAVGSGAWAGANPKKALDAATRSADAKVAALLERMQKGGGPVAAAADEDTGNDDDAGGDDKDDKAAKTADKDADSSSGDEESRPSKSGKKSAAASDDNAVAEEADEAPAGAVAPGEPWKGFDVQVGSHIYSRKLTFNQRQGAYPQEYSLPAGPAIMASADYFVTTYLGATAGGEYSFALISDDGAAKYKTSSFMFHGGLKGKTHFGMFELTGALEYALHKFEVTPDASDTNPPLVPPVSYSAVVPTIAGRYTLSPVVALFGGVSYMAVLNPGNIKSADWFPDAAAKGTGGFLGLAVRLPFFGLEGRASADFRNYALAMNSKMNDKYAAGGATDRYLGLNIALALRPGVR